MKGSFCLWSRQGALWYVTIHVIRFMRYKSIFSCKTYVENGEEKKKWYRVGYIKVTEKGGEYITWFSQPDTEFAVFEDEQEM